MQVLVAVLPVWLPASTTGEAVEGDPSAWAPATLVGDQMELQAGPDPAFSALWRAGQ